MRNLLICLIFLLPAGAFAQVYTWVNEQGVRVYSDEQPPAHAKTADLAPIIPLAPVKSPLKNTDLATMNPGFSGYTYFAIVSPSEDSVITPGSAGGLSVQLAIQPQLQPEDQVTLFLDGQPVETSASLSFNLNNLDRGSHLLYAEVKHQGKRLIQTSKRRIHVQRPFNTPPKKAPK